MHQEYNNKGLSGLANLGNTCYLNSCLQCLFHTYELDLEILKKNDYKNNTLLKEFNDLRKIMFNQKCTVAPHRFVSCVQKISKKKNTLFQDWSQNDCSEFLIFLIDDFHDTIKRKVNMSIVGEKINKKDELAIKCYNHYKNNYKDNYSELLDLFHGIMVTEIKDNDESKLLSSSTNSNFIISLSIPVKPNVTLYDCFNLFTKYEHLNGENEWYNEKTKEKQEVYKRDVFWSLPKILVIDLKRFNNRGSKSNAIVDFPLHDLDMSKYIVGYKKENTIYDCYAVCNHSGILQGGHYNSYVKNANNKWYLFNDTNITEVKNESKIITHKAYVLFYRRRIN